MSAEKTNQLIDLLADQQTRNIGRGHSPGTGRTSQQYVRDSSRRTTAEIAALIGQDKVDDWAAYQKSLPDRSQLNQVRDQLDQAGVPMTESQRTELLAAITEESQRRRGRRTTRAAAGRDDGADEPVADRIRQGAARSREAGADTEQYKAYKEYQDWQTEMRNSFPGPRGVMRAGVGVAVDSAFAAPVILPAPMPPPERR